MKKTVRNVLVAIIVISGCTPLKKSTGKNILNTNNEKNVIFLVDISTSTAPIIEEPQKKKFSGAIELVTKIVVDEIVGKPVSEIYDETKKIKPEPERRDFELVSNTIESLDEKVNFTLIVFRAKPRPWRNSLVISNRRNKSNANSFLKEVEIRGESNLYGGLKLAYRIANQRKVKGNVSIYLFTDGYHNMGEVRKLDDIVNKVAEWNVSNKIKLNTVGVYSDFDKDFLIKLAESTGGKFIEFY